MEKRFEIRELYICPFYRVEKGLVKPDLSYPTRVCVIDNEKGIAVDIKTNLKYEYIQTASHLYFMNRAYEKIKENERVAIFPFALLSYGSFDIKEVQKIITKLESNKEFQDGNKVLNNEQYLEYIKNEKLEKEKGKQKKITKGKN